MTCIVGLIDGGKVWMGGDSAAVSDLSMQTRRDPKVFRAGEYLIGCTSSFRMGQLLRFGNPPKLHDAELYEFMVTQFVPWMRELFKAGGFMELENNKESGGIFLVGLAGRLFFVGHDMQIGEMAEPYCAVGCGQDVALGCLWGTRKQASPKARVLSALEAAEAFSAGVRRPFHVLSV